MKAKKLPSGSWRCRAYGGTDENGKPLYKSFTAATAREAERMAYEWKYNTTNKTLALENITLKKAMEDFNNIKEKVLSPSTHLAYEAMRKNAYKSIENYPLSKITNTLIQGWVNQQAPLVTPKTITNRYSYLKTLLKAYRPDLNVDVLLPQKKKAEYHVISDDEMKLLLRETEGTELGLAIRLAAFIPARRSEICAICPKTDLKGNYLTINKAMVQDVTRAWVIKQPKSYAGYRTVELPPEIIAMIPKKAERAISCNPSILYEKFRNKLDDLGLSFRFHDLRHYGATFLHAQGVPDKYIMQRGGWSSAATLQNIYTHCLPEKTDETTKSVIAKFNSLTE